jgi:thiol-disulfide isomerase/thioredoxin
MASRTATLILLSFLFCSLNAQKPPSAAALVKDMQNETRRINLLSYNVETTIIYPDQEDSIAKWRGTVWLKSVPTDTVFGTYFHIKNQMRDLKSEYYYDGINGIDIIHEYATAKAHEKKVTMIEPYMMGNGMNSTKVRSSVIPYCDELVDRNIASRWRRYIDSMIVTEHEDKKAWVLSWVEHDTKYGAVIEHKAVVDKKSLLIRKTYRKSLWNGTTHQTIRDINNIKINDKEDEAFITLKESFPDYKTVYIKPSAENKVTVPTLTGTAAKDFTYTSFTDKSFSLMPKGKKLLLIDFWETWCGYCILAFPKIKALHEKYSGKGLGIAGVVTENKNQAKKIAASQEFPYETVFGDQNILDYYKVAARPRYLLIDDKGMVVGDVSGDLGKLEEIIKKKLEQ